MTDDSPWIDVEDELPEPGTRVIVLLPFGLRVEDDTWTENGWMNNVGGYISHWQPIQAPGTYAEIMQRNRGSAATDKVSEKSEDDWFTPAMQEHMRMMDAIFQTQIKLRMEMAGAVESDN